MNEEKLIALLIGGGTLRRTGVPMRASELSKKFKLEWKSAKRWERVLARIPMAEAETIWDSENNETVTSYGLDYKHGAEQIHGTPIIDELEDPSTKSRYDIEAEKARREWYESGKWREYVVDEEGGGSGRSRRDERPFAELRKIREIDKAQAREYARSLWSDDDDDELSRGKAVNKKGSTQEGRTVQPKIEIADEETSRDVEAFDSADFSGIAEAREINEIADSISKSKEGVSPRSIYDDDYVPLPSKKEEQD